MINRLTRRAFVSVLALSSILMAGAQAQLPDPILYFDFEDDGDVAVDKAAGGFNGDIDSSGGDAAVVDGGAPDGDTPGKAIQLNGGHIRVEDFDVVENIHGSDYTMACWLRPDAAALEGGSFIFGQGNEGIHNGVRVHDSNGAIPALHTAHWGADSSAGTELVADTWVHAVWTYDSEKRLANVYLNGVNDLEDFSQTAPNGDGILIVGSRNNGEVDQAFEGLLDEVKIWNQVLTPGQIAEISNAEDTDGDGLPDGYEMQVAGNLAALSRDGDADADGLTDFAEFAEHQTNPQNEDSDGDTLKDGDEVAGVAPRPATSPNTADTDSDGLTDLVESNTGTFVSATDTGTDPTNDDSDGDTFKDAFEVAQGTSPVDGQDTPDGGLPIPKLYYDFEGPITDEVADKSGEGHPGLLSGDVQSVPGAPTGSTPGIGFLFADDGSNCLDVDLTMEDLLDADGGYTMMAWIKPSKVGGQHILFGQAGQGVHNGIRNGGFLHQAHWGNDDDAQTTLEIDEWVHAAWVYDRDAAEGKIYLNGVEDGTSAKNDPNMLGPMIIGNRDGCGGGNGFGGVADDVAIWSEVLTDAQIAELAAGASPIGVVAGDEDADDLPDSYETALAGNLTDLNGKGAGPGPGAGTGDFDGDGRTDQEEFSGLPATNPVMADSDGDTLSDGDELAGAGDRPPTNPNKADTDGDGLSDGVENNTGIFVDASQTGTNPIVTDTDGSGGSDGAEIANGTNPLDANDPTPLVAGDLPIPIIYYSFDELNDTSVPDQSRNGFNGAAQGLELTEGAPGSSTPDGALSFPDDNTGCIETGLVVEDLLAAGGYTMSAWIRPTDVSGQRILFGQTAQGIHNGIRNAEVLHQAHWGNDDDATTTLFVDEWVHAAWVYDADAAEGKIYLNGELDGESAKNPPNNVASQLIVGNRDGCGGGDGYRGDVDDVAIWSEVLTEDQIVLLADGASPIGATGTRFLITDISREGLDVSLTWESEPGNIYAVETSPDLVTWTAIVSEIPDGGATDVLSSYTDTAAPADATLLYYRVRQLPPPARFRDDFESGAEGWTAVTDAGETMWELGTPNVEGLTAANSGANAWGTNLAGNYTPESVARLRSPVIDVTGVSSPKLDFSYFIDAREGEGGQIRYLSEDGGELFVDREMIFTDTSDGWQALSIRLPSQVTDAGKFIIEFALLTDGNDDVGAGWYIDDVVVD